MNHTNKFDEEGCRTEADQTDSNTAFEDVEVFRDEFPEEEEDDSPPIDEDDHRADLLPQSDSQASVVQVEHLLSNKAMMLLCLIAIGLVIMFTWLLTSFEKPYPKSHASSNHEDMEVPETTTFMPTTAPVNRPTGCVFSDRFDNEHNSQHNKLYAGQYICSKNKTNHKAQHHRYQFGLSPSGDLVLQDTLIPDSPTNKYNQLFYQNPNASAVGEDYYFSLQTNGTFVVHNGPEEVWKLAPIKPMHLTPQCLQDHDCPYLHLHAGSVLVVNYIDANDSWQQKNVLKVYKLWQYKSG